MLWDVNNRTCEQRQLGSSNTTRHQPILRFWFRLSWLNTTFLWFVRLSTILTWLLAIFFFFVLFPKMKMSLKETRFESREDIKRNATRLSCTLFPKRASWNASKIGGIVERSLCSSKASTLKRIMVSDLQVSYCIFPQPKVEYFLNKPRKIWELK